MKSRIIIFTILVLSFFLVSCGGDSSGVENSPIVQNATKAFQIGANAESYDSLKLAVKALQEKSTKEIEANSKAATESYTIRLNWDKTDAGATISEINAEVKLDFQGHILTLENGSEGIVIANTGKAVEIANGTVQVAEGATLKSGTTAVITASTDTTLSASVNASNTAADAIATTGGNFSIRGSAQIISRSNQKSINATESANVKVSSSQVVLTGGMRLDGNANVDLGDATLRLTQDIEKGDKCKLEVKTEKVEPQNENVHQDKIDEARHNHTFAEEWSSDSTHHWHESTCDHDVKSDFAEHNWGDWVVTTAATHTTTGTRTKTCSVCGKEESEVIPANTEAHTFAEEWSSDSTHHWHESTCGHDVIDGVSDHLWGEWNTIINATEDLNGEECRRCLVCDYSSFRNIPRLVDTPPVADENLFYITSEGVLFGRNGLPDRFIIPSSINGIEVKEIGEQAFRGTDIKRVVIPDTVTDIRDNAFAGCSGLIEIVIPNSVTTIGEAAFGSCSNLSKIIIPDSVLEIKSYAFYNCISLQEILISDSVQSIGSRAFCNCSSLQEITIPDSVISLGDLAFYDCSELRRVSIGDGVNKIPRYTFFNCSKLADVSIGNSVTIIGERAFANCNKIEKLILPESIVAIGQYAFLNCIRLHEINICANSVSFGVAPFANCFLLSDFPEVYINSLHGDIQSEFQGCKSLETITIPSSVTSIGSLTFYGCVGLKEVFIPSSVTKITDAFQGCTSLTTIIIPNSVTNIDYAFKGCTSLANISIPESVTSMNGTFEGCTSLASIIIPESVTSLAATFSGCTSLTTVNIPHTINTINSTFYGCSSLKNITIPDSVTTIGDYTFSGCSSIKHIEIPSSVTSIGEGVFSGCTSLTSITLPNSLTSIVKDMFMNCSSLSSLTIPANVTSIGSRAFYSCSSLKEIVLPGSVSSIGKDAFHSCYSLENIEFDNTKTEWDLFVYKSSRWYYYIATNVVHCVDGDCSI